MVIKRYNFTFLTEEQAEKVKNSIEDITQDCKYKPAILEKPKMMEGNAVVRKDIHVIVFIAEESEEEIVLRLADIYNDLGA